MKDKTKLDDAAVLWVFYCWKNSWKDELKIKKSIFPEKGVKSNPEPDNYWVSGARTMRTKKL